MPTYNSLRISLVIALLTIFVAACGGTAPHPASPAAATEEAIEAPTAGDDEIAIEGLRGTIPEDDVRKTMEGNMGSFLQCYEKAYDINDGIQGAVELEMEVGPRGNVITAFLSKSELGATVAERCIVKRALRLEFPPTQGGGNAEISYEFLFQAPYELPMIDPLDAADFAPLLNQHADALADCIGGGRGITLIVFINKDGSGLTAGAASTKLEMYPAALCVADLATTWRLNAPEGDMAKGILTF